MVNGAATALIEGDSVIELQPGSSQQPMKYALLVTGPPYGTQSASSAYQFARTLNVSRRLSAVFFYHDGVMNANSRVSPASDEFDLVRGWQQLWQLYGVKMHICSSAALRRGTMDDSEAEVGAGFYNAMVLPGFIISGLGSLAEIITTCDRIIQF